MLNTIQNKIFQVPSEFTYRATLVNHARNLPTLAAAERQIVDALNNEGVFVTSLKDLAFTSTPPLINASKSLLSSIMSVSHSQGDDSRYVNSVLQERSAQFVTFTDYPEFFLWGLEERLLNIVENYIRLPVAYHGVNFRRDVGSDKRTSTQLWHKDGEDRRIVKIIIYLNDVGEDNGPFQYIPKQLTPSYQSFRHIYRKVLRTGFSDISDEELSKISHESNWRSCIGPAGTVILVDTRSVFHRGKPPNLERSALFYVYTSRNPKRPDICKANFEFDEDKLTALAMDLPQRQKDCIFWEREQ